MPKSATREAAAFCPQTVIVSLYCAMAQASDVAGRRQWLPEPLIRAVNLAPQGAGSIPVLNAPPQVYGAPGAPAEATLPHCARNPCRAPEPSQPEPHPPTAPPNRPAPRPPKAAPNQPKRPWPPAPQTGAHPGLARCGRLIKQDGTERAAAAAERAVGWEPIGRGAGRATVAAGRLTKRDGAGWTAEAGSPVGREPIGRGRGGRLWRRGASPSGAGGGGEPCWTGAHREGAGRATVAAGRLAKRGGAGRAAAGRAVGWEPVGQRRGAGDCGGGAPHQAGWGWTDSGGGEPCWKGAHRTRRGARLWRRGASPSGAARGERRRGAPLDGSPSGKGAGRATVAAGRLAKRGGRRRVALLDGSPSGGARGGRLWRRGASPSGAGGGGEPCWTGARRAGRGAGDCGGGAPRQAAGRGAGGGGEPCWKGARRARRGG